MAAGDEVTDLEVGTDKLTFHMPYAMTLTEVIAEVVDAATGATLLEVDIHKAGVTVLSTQITLDAGEETSATATTPPVISVSALAKNDRMTIDIVAVGNTLAGKGLKIWLIGTRA